MKKIALTVIALLGLGVGLLAVAPEQKDVVGCKDHPMFTRMPGYWIHHCKQSDFNARAFTVGVGKTQSVEGKSWEISYYPQASWTTKPSQLQILRNYENAVKQQGGVLIWSDAGKETLKLTPGGREIWVEVTAEFTGKYGLAIVERQAMVQDVVVKAEALAGDLQTAGKTAVYGIYFDTDKSEIKPASDPALAEIAKLLQGSPALKLYIVGHTDGVGSLEHNLQLSQARAEAVAAALVSRHGITAARLTARGVGPLAPVASNDAEDGRARNRRVELVKQ